MPDQTRRYREGPGYDHDHYAWNPLPGREPISWPNSARLALCVFVYFEYLELDPPGIAVSDGRFAGPLGSYHPDFQNYSRREFGNRVGIFRVLNLLERYGVKATICANAMAAARYPYIVERCRDGGHDFAAHGWSLNRMITSSMSASEERDHINQCLDSLQDSLGERPTGWAGQDFGAPKSAYPTYWIGLMTTSPTTWRQIRTWFLYPINRSGMTRSCSRCEKSIPGGIRRLSPVPSKSCTLRAGGCWAWVFTHGFSARLIG